VSVLAIVRPCAHSAEPGARQADREAATRGTPRTPSPTAEHVEEVVRLPTRYRLPALVLDATGVRIGELEALTWGGVDEPRQRWRVSGAVAKTGRARWVPMPSALFDAVTQLVPREDRVPDRPIFQGFRGDRFRTALTRACTAAGVPHFSPHDLRHRRVSLLHLGGMPWARIGELVGHDDLITTARTYTQSLLMSANSTTCSCSRQPSDRARARSSVRVPPSHPRRLATRLFPFPPPRARTSVATHASRLERLGVDHGDARSGQMRRHRRSWLPNSHAPSRERSSASVGNTAHARWLAPAPRRELPKPLLGRLVDRRDANTKAQPPICRRKPRGELELSGAGDLTARGSFSRGSIPSARHLPEGELAHARGSLAQASGFPNRR
jgi:Phage integrase family